MRSIKRSSSSNSGSIHQRYVPIVLPACTGLYDLQTSAWNCIAAAAAGQQHTTSNLHATSYSMRVRNAVFFAHTNMQEQECSGNPSFSVRTYLFFEHTAKVAVSSSKAWHEPDSCSIAVYSLSDQPLVLHCIACMCAQQSCITVAVSAQ
eukprot:19963-Heterococcus_DN1.PRE.5